MPLQQRMVVAGLSAGAARAIQGTVASGLTAAGSTQATALALGADTNDFTTVGSGTGAILPPMSAGDEVFVFNGGANALLVYPPVGGTINALAANAGYSVATATPSCFVICINATTFRACQSA